jgi:hypothetical protein
MIRLRTPREFCVASVLDVAGSSNVVVPATDGADMVTSPDVSPLSFMLAILLSY